MDWSSFNFPKAELSFVETWPLMSSRDILFIIITYLAFVLKIGPALMINRPALLLNKLLVSYNAAKVMSAGIVAYNSLIYLMDKGLFPRNCNHDDTTIYRIAKLSWMFMVCKVTDLCDTIFFVIRKKSNQITFLHVYHHTFMVMMIWTGLKYNPTDHWAFMAVTNSCIHMIMYTYYGIAAMGPEYARYLWWKKYLTMMQLIQFVLIICHLAIQTYTSDCPMHSSTYWVVTLNVGLFLWLFADFYNSRYRLKEKNVIGFACAKQAVD